jgi:hypothetical protein
LVSANAFGGIAERAVSAVLADAQPFVSEAFLEEYRDIAAFVSAARASTAGRVPKGSFYLEDDNGCDPSQSPGAEYGYVRI